MHPARELGIALAIKMAQDQGIITKEALGGKPGLYQRGMRAVGKWVSGAGQKVSPNLGQVGRGGERSLAARQTKARQALDQRAKGLRGGAKAKATRQRTKAETGMERAMAQERQRSHERIGKGVVGGGLGLAGAGTAALGAGLHRLGEEENQ